MKEKNETENKIEEKQENEKWYKNCVCVCVKGEKGRKKVNKSESEKEKKDVDFGDEEDTVKIRLLQLR